MNKKFKINKHIRYLKQNLNKDLVYPWIKLFKILEKYTKSLNLPNKVYIIDYERETLFLNFTSDKGYVEFFISLYNESDIKASIGIKNQLKYTFSSYSNLIYKKIY